MIPKVHLQVSDATGTPHSKTNGLVLTVTSLLGSVASSCMDPDECSQAAHNLLRTNFQLVRGPVAQPLKYGWLYDPDSGAWKFFRESIIGFQVKQSELTVQVDLISRELNPARPQPRVSPPGVGKLEAGKTEQR